MKKYNPFIIDSEYISEEYFCDRVIETQQLIKNIINGRNTVLTAVRRMGKSGLIAHCFNQQEIKKNYKTFYVDLYSTSSLAEMVSLMGKEIVDSLKGRGEKFLDGFLSTVQSLVTSLAIDTVTGQPTLNISIGNIQQPEQTLKEIFKYLENSEKPCVVAIDEFQQIAEYPEKNIVALLRSYVQKCKQTQFIFAGSKRRMMDKLFNSPSEPFYQSCVNLYLEAIDRQVYMDFSSKHFAYAEKHLDLDAFVRMYDHLEGHTWYLQMLLNEMFASLDKGQTADLNTLNEALQTVLNLNKRSFEENLQRLTNPQKEVLIAIAKEYRAKGITSASFIRKHGLKSASSTQSALRWLYENEIVTREDNEYYVTNRFFGIWLSNRYGISFRF